MTEQKRETYRKLFLSTFRLSACTFGGGFVIIPLMKKKFVDELGWIEEEEMLDQDIEDLIAERQAARKAKNFARADEIRNLLLEKGIILEDTREGVKWKRA